MQQFKMNRQEYENILFKELLHNLFRSSNVISNIQIDSFNFFLEHRLQKIIEEDHIINVEIDKNQSIKVRFGQVYVDFPYIIDNKRDIKYISPHESRVRELTYSSCVSVDIQVETFLNHQLMNTSHHSKILLARIPMMIGSKKCNLTRKEEHDIEECKYDPGGYFIIKGKERVLISQERGNLNQIYVFRQKNANKYNFFAELRAMSEENGHSVLIHMKLSPELYKVVLSTPFFQQDIDLVYILKYYECTIEDLKIFFEPMREHNATIKMFLHAIIKRLSLLTRETVINHLCDNLLHSMMKEVKEQYIEQIMTNDIFLNLGISSTKAQKKLFLFVMLKRLLMTAVGQRVEDDRDHLRNKRFETAGYLVSELFRSLYKRFLRLIEQQLQKKQDLLVAISRINLISQGIKSCFSTGNWGIPKSNYIRCGVSQILSRLSYNATLSHLRRILIPIGKEGKNSKIRQIHCSQFGYICANECFDPMTLIKTWNGHNKYAKDIQKGDVLINEEWKPTVVQDTVSGEAFMYDVLPFDENFMSHIVTWNHILTLLFQSDETQFTIIDIRLGEYLKLTPEMRYKCFLFKKNGDNNQVQTISLFQIKERGIGLFVGCRLNGSGRFCLADGTVTHNTPEGGSAGIVKSFSLFAKVSNKVDACWIRNLLEDHFQDVYQICCPMTICETDYHIFLNGIWIGLSDKAEEFVHKFKEFRRSRLIPSTLSISMLSKECVINIYSDDGRILRPLWNLKEFSKEEIEKQLLEKKSWESLCSDGLIEYVDAHELENAYVSMYFDESTPEHTYCEIHPSFIFGVCVNLIPYVDHIQAPRITYQSAMSKQAIGIFSGNSQYRSDTVSHVLCYPEKPVVQTHMSELLNYDQLASGNNVIVAIACYGGYNQEDSIILNKGAIDRGLFRSFTYKTIMIEERKRGSYSSEIIELPEESIRNKLFNYDKLSSKGIIKVGSYVGTNDVVVGKTVQNSKKTNSYSKMDSSVVIKNGEEGYIDSIFESVTPDGYLMIKIKLRTLKIPEMGDKFAARSAQKGVVGLIMNQEDMPFTSEGIVPDVIINPHCFIGNTLVSFVNGTAKRIDGIMYNDRNPIWSFNDEKQKIENSFSSKSTCYGIKHTIKLTFIDGRELICTPDHNIRIIDENKNLQWKEAKDIQYTDKIIMGMRGTEDVVGNDESEWELNMEEYKFHMRDEENREKSLAFARILGYLLTDGSLNIDTNDRYRGCLFMGSIIDALSILEDIYIVTGKRVKIQDKYSSFMNAHTYRLDLPVNFLKSLCTLHNIMLGKKTTQLSKLPSFLINSPVSFIREFLGGLFGGDGETTYYYDTNYKTFTKVGFSQTILKQFQSSLETTFNLLICLMKKVGVNSKIVRIRNSVSRPHVQDLYNDFPRIIIHLSVESNEMFRKYIGFRHCIQKMLRLEITCAYENYKHQVRCQNIHMINQIDKYLHENLTTIKKAIDIVRKQIYQDINPLHPIHSLISYAYYKNLKRPHIFNVNKNLRNIMYAKQFLDMCGCPTWFDKKTYIVDRCDTNIPFFTLSIMKKEDWTMEPVYCVTVDKFHKFMANGSLVRNCMPSRMTVNQLMECVAAKSAVIRGDYVYSTPFSTYSHDIVPKLTSDLKECGYQRNGNEMMINGITGKPFKTEIFIGPTYYQRLKHLVSNKIHARDHGSVQTLVRQPLEGRSKDGGLRFGEMERDACMVDSPISLVCGLSIKIQEMYDCGWGVLGWDKKKNGLIPSVQTQFLDKGYRECFEVTFEDGRKMYPSIRHPFLTNNNKWVRANEIIPMETILKVGVQYPVIDLNDDIIKCNNWSMIEIGLETDNVKNMFRSFAFMRILGLLTTDGHIVKNENQNRGQIYLGHILDVNSCLDDIHTVFGKMLPHQMIDNHYCISLPSEIMKKIVCVKGLVRGDKTRQKPIFPDFILDSNCPVPIIREFLGGMFGGDGHTCILSMHRDKRDILTSVGYSKSISYPLLESLKEYMIQLKNLLHRCGVNQISIQNAKETTCSKAKHDSNKEDRIYSITLHIDLDDLISFYDKVGFRHCIHKSQRLEVAVSYRRLRQEVIRQHNWLVQRVDQITDFKNKKMTNPECKIPTKKAIEKAVKELIEIEPLIHKYAVPTTHDITDHLIKGTQFGKFRSKSFPNAEEFVTHVGALEWFVKRKEDNPNILDGVSYGVHRDLESIPTMNLKVIHVKSIGPQKVYDIQVDKTESFLVNGVVAHNCMISHGVSKFLNERLFDLSDKFQIPVCKKCGFLIHRPNECNICDHTEEESICMVPLPYACKLLFQELIAMGMKVCMNVEKN